MKRPPEADFLSGAADVLHKDKYASGGFVIPKALKAALENISPKDAAAEDVWRKAGKGVARWLTVYNPKNLSLNIGSDLVTALMGMPGEKAQPLGILRWYGKTARGVVNAAVHGDKYMVRVGGVDHDVMALALRAAQPADRVRREPPSGLRACPSHRGGAGSHGAHREAQ
jgi:hypothetical protein